MINSYVKKGLLEGADLASLLKKKKNVKLIDASFVMPDSPVNAKDMFFAKRIGDAVYFDINHIADSHSDLPHMLPDPDEFSAKVSALGLSNNDFIVVYDQSGIAMAAARVWWMFRVFGHDNICVLNGGLPAWEKAGLALNCDPPQEIKSGKFTARFRPELVKNIQEVTQASLSKGVTIIDARGAERFSGQVPEPRDNMRAGHIPGSINLPFMTLIDAEDGGLKNTETLKSLLKDIPSANEIIASCGSGVTACVLALAFYNTGQKDVAVYDGSWSEWGHEKSDTKNE